MKWYFKCIKQYVDFHGRARRTEFWSFVLFNILFSIVFFSIDMILLLNADFMIFGFIYMPFMILPSIAVTVRRLHDVGKSGVYFFIGLIPLVGNLWILFLLLKDGEPFENNWGLDPKEAERAEEMEMQEKKEAEAAAAAAKAAEKQKARAEADKDIDDGGANPDGKIESITITFNVRKPDKAD